MTLNELKAAITKYVGKTAFTDLQFTVDGVTVDTLMQAINNAKRLIQYRHDFEACRDIGKVAFETSEAPDPIIIHAHIDDFVLAIGGTSENWVTRSTGVTTYDASTEFLLADPLAVEITAGARLRLGGTEYVCAITAAIAATSVFVIDAPTIALVADLEEEPVTVTWADIGTVSSAAGDTLLVTGITSAIAVGEYIRVGTQCFKVTAPVNPGDLVITVDRVVDGFPSGTLELRSITFAETQIEVKKIEQAYYSDSFTPIEFMSREQYVARVKQFIGRNYGATYTPPEPVIVQHGRQLILQESEVDVSADSDFYFDVIKILPDYGASSTDWFLENGYEYLLWQGIVELNKLTKEFVPIEEGNLDEPTQKAEEAALALIARDMAYRGVIQPRVPPPAPPTPRKPSK